MDVFRATLAFLERHKVPLAYFYILTPHKGTPPDERMKRESRIIGEKQIGRTPGMICHIKPTCCSPEELERNVQTMYEEFYSLPSMLTRLPPPVTRANIASWILNFSQRRMRGVDRHAQNFE